MCAPSRSPIPETSEVPHRDPKRLKMLRSSEVAVAVSSMLPVGYSRRVKTRRVLAGTSMYRSLEGHYRRPMKALSDSLVAQQRQHSRRLCELLQTNDPPKFRTFWMDEMRFGAS